MDKRARRFTLEIDAARCRSCAVCWDPQVCEPQVLGFEPPFNKAVVLDIAACTGCRQCEWLCPDWAIVVRDVQDQAAETTTATTATVATA